MNIDEWVAAQHEVAAPASKTLPEPSQTQSEDLKESLEARVVEPGDKECEETKLPESVELVEQDKDASVTFDMESASVAITRESVSHCTKLWSLPVYAFDSSG